MSGRPAATPEVFIVRIDFFTNKYNKKNNKMKYSRFPGGPRRVAEASFSFVSSAPSPGNHDPIFFFFFFMDRGDIYKNDKTYAETMLIVFICETVCMVEFRPSCIT